MKKLIATAVLILTLPLLTACPGNPVPTNPVEQEDCDAEDMRNRETDCGFSKPHPTTKKPPATTKSPTKPATRRTTR